MVSRSGLATVFQLESLDWVDERKEPNQAPKLIEAAERSGALAAHHQYAFVVGPEGMEFNVVR